MPYITKEDFLANYLVKEGQDVLSSTVMNNPRQALANNLDHILPLIEYLRTILGDNYELGRLDGVSPNYSNTRYVRKGQSYREAIMTLDKTARDLYNFILSQTSSVGDDVPFITVDGEVITPPDRSILSWYLVPEEAPKVWGSEGPVAVRSIYAAPLVFAVGNELDPRRLVGMNAKRDGDGGGIFELWESPDAGDTWSKISNFTTHNMFNNTSNDTWCGAYRRADGLLDFGLGINKRTPESGFSTYSGTASYTLGTDNRTTTWTFTRYTSSKNIVYRGLEPRRARSPRACLLTRVNLANTQPEVAVGSSNFSEYRPDTVPDFYPVLNPSDDSVTWGAVQGNSLIELSDGTILGIISGKINTTYGTKFQLYKYFITITTDESGDTVTVSVPELLDISATNNYVQPYLTQLATISGGTAVVLSFTTDEGATLGLAPDRVKVVISNNSGLSFHNKSLIYQYKHTQVAGSQLSGGSRIVQLITGEIYCFMEEAYSATDRRLVRSKLRIW